MLGVAQMQPVGAPSETKRLEVPRKKESSWKILNLLLK
jgi:hypothetical protein